MKLKKLLTLSMMCSVALVGCASSDASSTTSNNTTSSSSSDDSSSSSSSSADTSSSTPSLVVYSNSATEGRGEWVAEKASEAGFDISIVSGGGAEITERLIIEKNSPIADVVWGPSAVECEKLKSENVLVEINPSWGADVDPAYSDPEGYYWAIALQPLGYAYDTSIISADEIANITDITQLASMYPGQYQMHPLSGGTAKNTLASILVRYADPNGEYGVSEEGWEVAKQYIQNGYMTTTGEAYWENVVNGQMPFVSMWGSGMLLNETEYNADFEFIYAESGLPILVEQLAVVEGTDNYDTAQAFVEWFGSAEIQAQFSLAFGTTPAHPDALAVAPDNVLDLMSKVTPQVVDWGLVAQYQDAWVEKVSLEFLY
ncbi:MAG: hypothetical protein ATN35_11620 [Epulopiscium sp. Nele67-Bin004]|nr:MAG: hypothetical protein ATN35_11620 [Epulopiscium sp. Nele67-Bin004]